MHFHSSTKLHFMTLLASYNITTLAEVMVTSSLTIRMTHRSGSTLFPVWIVIRNWLDRLKLWLTLSNNSEIEGRNEKQFKIFLNCLLWQQKEKKTYQKAKWHCVWWNLDHFLCYQDNQVVHHMSAYLLHDTQEEPLSPKHTHTQVYQQTGYIACSTTLQH